MRIGDGNWRWELADGTHLSQVGPILLGDGAVRLKVGFVPHENHWERLRVFDPQDLRVEPLDLIKAAG